MWVALLLTDTSVHGLEFDLKDYTVQTSEIARL